MEDERCRIGAEAILNKMKRKIITVDECMSMSEQELIAFIEADNKMLNEGIGNINESNVDFQGMTTEDIVKKYNCIPMEEVFRKIRNKLKGWCELFVSNLLEENSKKPSDSTPFKPHISIISKDMEDSYLEKL